MVQAYLEPTDQREPLRLVGFCSLQADPGETLSVTLTIAPSVLATWTADGWSPRPGPHRLWVGRSAGDLRLSAEVLPVPAAGGAGGPR